MVLEVSDQLDETESSKYNRSGGGVYILNIYDYVLIKIFVLYFGEWFLYWDFWPLVLNHSFI